MKAQGSLEYLIIIASVLAIAAIVVLFLTNALNIQAQASGIGNCKEAASRCKTELVTSTDPKCPYCYDYCVTKAGTEIFPGAYNLCLTGHAEQIFEGATDTAAPVIENAETSNAASSGILVTWDTDEPATGLVVYAVFVDSEGNVNPNYIDELSSYAYTQGSSDLSLPHSIQLSGLSPGTQYVYRLESADGSGNKGTAGPFFFETLP
jgi:hypothetical protein